MTIRKLFPLPFVAAVAVAMSPERVAAQCWRCDTCSFPSTEPVPQMCVARLQGHPVGWKNCHSDRQCACELRFEDIGFCLDRTDATGMAAEAVQLKGTLAAIRELKPIPADGPFVYLKQGADFVVRRKCDGAEMGRVAIAEVRSGAIVVGG